MKGTFPLSMAAAALLALAAPAPAQQLPDAPGKDSVVKLCSTCHPPERGASVRAFGVALPACARNSAASARAASRRASFLRRCL